MMRQMRFDSAVTPGNGKQRVKKLKKVQSVALKNYTISKTDHNIVLYTKIFKKGLYLCPYYRYLYTYCIHNMVGPVPTEDWLGR